MNADDINDDDQHAHSSIDGDAEDSDEKDSQNSKNKTKNIIHNKNAVRLYSILMNKKKMFVKFLQKYFTVYIHNVALFFKFFSFFFTR